MKVYEKVANNFISLDFIIWIWFGIWAYEYDVLWACFYDIDNSTNRMVNYIFNSAIRKKWKMRK